MTRRPTGLEDALCYGGDYNPEQWPEPVWAEDVALMREAGVTLVTVGVFSWSSLEPRPGDFTFGWLDRVLDLLHAAGIRVALATPTASPPPWFSAAHPEALPVGPDGVRLTHGSRDTYCVSAPAYRAAARRIATELAARYAHHPAVALWHVHNEYGTTCHCALAAAAFRTWLRQRHGSLAALNEAWVTAFWSQGYGSWEEIQPPRATQYLGNPGQLLDWRRFLSDELLGAYLEQKEILRAANPRVPITTNYVQGGWVPVDHAAWAAHVDLVAVDDYPSDAGPGAEEQTAFTGDLARGWGGGEWLLMETAPNLIYTPTGMHTKEPGRMTRHSLSYVARGSRGAMYFQWRAPAGGAERFHSALVPHAGPDGRVFREAVDLGARLPALASLPPVSPAHIAIAWDAASWWALQGPGLPAPVDYPAAVRAVHRACYRGGFATDFVFPGLAGFAGALTAYRVLVLPLVFLLSDEAAGAVREWVRGGGHLVVTPLSGIADEHGRVRLGGYPGALRDVLGVRVTAWLAAAAQACQEAGDFGPTEGWAEEVTLDGALAVAHYPAGSPAVTRHSFGAGTAWYVAGLLGDAGCRRLIETVTGAAGVAPVLAGLPEGVEAVRRGSQIVLINHTDSFQSVGKFELPAGEVVTVVDIAG